jgi:hypothetical protein
VITSAITSFDSSASMSQARKGCNMTGRMILFSRADPAHTHNGTVAERRTLTTRRATRYLSFEAFFMASLALPRSIGFVEFTFRLQFLSSTPSKRHL